MFAHLCIPLHVEAARGGWRQRLNAPAAALPRPPSRQALGMLREWGDGMLSTRQVCWHMHLAVQDGECTHPMVHRLSQLYNPRRSSSGIATNLVNLLEECEVSTSIVELPPGCICTHMVSPYRILQSISVRHPADFPRIMGLRVELNRRFWEN